MQNVIKTKTFKTKRHLPNFFIGIVGGDRPKDHHFRATSLQKRDLILLTKRFECRDFLGHFDQSPNGYFGQVNYVDQRRVGQILEINKFTRMNIFLQ